MRHLRLIKSGVDVRPILDEISRQPELWSIDSSRQDNIAPQRETQAISLYSFAEQAILDSEARRSRPISYRGRPGPLVEHLPNAAAFVQDLTREMRGVMGRAVITRLRPHGKILPHADERLYWLLRDRYHLVLKSAAGSHFRVGGEEVRMKEGELWWFDPTVKHEGFNESDEDRIHIIVDILSLHSCWTFLVRLTRSPTRSMRHVAIGLLPALAYRRLRARAARPAKQGRHLSNP